MSETITAFTGLLRQFNGIVDNLPEVNKVRKQLLEIKEAAEKNNELNLRQKEAIIARVDNYLDGSYGKKNMEAELKTK